MNWTRLKMHIREHEGRRLKPYTDSVGKLTIGYGRNLDDNGITEEEAEVMLSGDVGRAYESAKQIVGVHTFEMMSDIRQEALTNMAFNLGPGGLAKFHRMLRAIRDDDWSEAAKEALDSKWATQVGSRAQVIANWIRDGIDANGAD